VERPRPAAEFSACGRGNTVGLTSILDGGQFFELLLFHGFVR